MRKLEHSVFLLLRLGGGTGCSRWSGTMDMEPAGRCFCLASPLNWAFVILGHWHQDSRVWSCGSICFNVTVACWHSAHLQVEGEHSDEAALILHRRGYDCRFSSRDTGLLCSTTQGKVSWKVVFVWFCFLGFLFLFLLVELMCFDILTLYK